MRYDSQCCGAEPSGSTTRQPNGYEAGICSKCLRITDFNERPQHQYTTPYQSINERLQAIDDKLDRIEQLVMKFWDVPESGFDVVDEESQSIEK